MSKEEALIKIAVAEGARTASMPLAMRTVTGVSFSGSAFLTPEQHGDYIAGCYERAKASIAKDNITAGRCIHCGNPSIYTICDPCFATGAETEKARA